MIHTALFLALLAVAQSMPGEPRVNVPQYITAHPAEDYMPDISRDGRLMVFVSSRAGAPNIWVKTISSGEIQTPIRLTRGVSGEKSPRISPDGKRMVYVSYETDAEGDIYILDLKNIGKQLEFEGVPKRLTDISTADKEPAFSADGRSIIFTSSDKKGSKENLWMMNIKNGKRKQLTFKGGRLATVSPDGKQVTFVSSRGGERSALYTLEIASQKERRITKGEWIDSFPAYAGEQRIVFIRYLDDTNGDGEVTIDDNPSLFMLDLARLNKPPLPLTTSRQYNIFPNVNSGFIYYTAKDGSSVDIYKIPLEGVMPATGSLQKDIEQAIEMERFYPTRPSLSLLAWRRALSVNYDSKDHGRLAQALFMEARLLKKGGAYSLAEKALSRLTERYKDAPLYHGLARIEQIVIRAFMSDHSPEKVIASLEKIAGENGAPDIVKARAKIEMASWLIKYGHPAEGLKTLRQVVHDYPLLPSISAESAFKRNEVYQISGDRKKQIEVYLAVIRDYPGETKWARKAESRILKLNVIPGNFQKSSANLTAIIDKADTPPSLKAAAMNKIAQLYYDDNELVRARETFALTVGKFPNEPTARNHALFRIAEIYAEEENFTKALKTYRSIERDTQSKQEIYLKTRKGYIQKSLRKGWYELDQKETRIALKTFMAIIKYDSSVVEAYRGLIACRARLGEIDKAVKEFEANVTKEHGAYIDLYALGLALTYLDPPPLDRSMALIKSALVDNERTPWLHQTLGWIYEQKGRRSNDSDFLELALLEYNYARTLTDEKTEPKRSADLHLNLGNIHYLLKNYANAKSEYVSRKASDVKFGSPAQEALFYKRWGEIEYKLGDDLAAIKNYETALAIAKDENIPLKIELYERLALAHQSAREYRQAALGFIESLKLRRDMGAKENETVILRNIANNLFFLSKSEKEEDRSALREALEYYRESEKALKGFKDKEKKGTSALFAVDVETGVGGLKGASKGFSEEEERKLIYHHIGRIYGELADYANAILFFEKKLQLTRQTSNILDNVPVLTEKAIILNQLGFYQYKAGDIKKAEARFIESLDICQMLKSAVCLITNVDNLARLVIEHAGAMDAKDINEIMARGLTALGEAKENEPADKQEYGSALNHLATLYHNRFLRAPTEPEKEGVEAKAIGIKASAKDMVTAKRLYDEALAQVAKIKSVPALVARLDISINVATLLYDAGDTAGAVGRLDEVEKMASNVGLADMEWKAQYLKYRFDPSNNSAKLREAAATIESLPFGDGSADNNHFTLAMIRSLYGELAGKTKSDLQEISILERGKAVALRLSLAGMVTAKFSDDDIEGIGKLAELYKERTSLIAKKMAWAGGGDGAKADPLITWQKGYDAYLRSLEEINPLLADIASVDQFDIEPLFASLDDDEAAISLWRRADGIKLFVVTNGGVSVRSLQKEQDVVETINSDALFKSIRKIYLVTDRPFSDPLASRIAQTHLVSAIPSFASLYHFKASRSLNDFRLVAFGEKNEPLKSAKDNFLSGTLVTDDKALKAVRDGTLSASGILLFGGAPTVSSVDPVRGSFALTVEQDLTARLSFKELIGAKAAGSAIMTPSMRGENRLDWEGATAYLGLFAGFSSWVIVPDEAEAREAYYKLLLAGSDGARVAKNYGITKGEARLIGSFMFSAGERLKKAKAEFKDRIRAGVLAMKEEDWTLAGDQLERALVYANMAGNKKYDELLLQRLSQIRFTSGDYDKALFYREKLSAIFKEKGDQDKLADSYLLTGIIETRLKDDDSAVKNISEALRIYRKRGSIKKMASTLSKMGIVKEQSTQYRFALSQYREALKINRELGDEGKAAMELMRIGRIYHLRLSRFAEGRKNYSEALDIFRRIDNSRLIAGALIDLGALEVDAGALTQATAIFGEAKKIAQATGDGNAEALALFHLANVHWFRGEYERAFSSIRASIEKAKAIADRGLIAMAHNTLGLIYLTLNDYPQAMENLDISLSIARAIGERLDEATSLSNMGLVQRKMGKLEGALGYFKKAKLIDDELKSDWGKAHSARNISITYLQMGKVKLADKYARSAVTIAGDIGDRISLARSTLQLADVIAQKGDHAAAFKMYQKAVAMADETQVKEVLWRGLRGMGRSLKATGDLSGAIAAYKKGVELVESMRADIKSDFLKQGFLDDKQELYEELILLLLDKKRVKEAFAYSERSRARGFIDLMGMSKIKFKNKREQEAYDRATRLKRKLDELAVSIASGEKNDALIKERRAIQDDYTNTIEWLRREAPEVLPFIKVEPIDSDRLLSLIGEEATLLEYVMTADELVIFVVGDGRIDVRRVSAGKKDIAKLIARYRKLIQDRAPIGNEARELGKIVIEPVISMIDPAKVLGIIPHGALHYLSFAALELGDRYLIDKVALFYLPTASLLEYTIARRRKIDNKKMKVLAIGNPDLGTINTDLPLAELEARSIKWVYPSLDLYTRGDATESQVANNSASFDIIHIASHGQFDPVNPLESALILTADTQNDGKLKTSEIFSLGMKADIVTLSACQTGLGKVTQGDEVVGMNRAFLFAGAHTILSTLWRVDDMASAILVKHFYRALPNATKAEALRKTQLIIKKRWRHPAFWAGFTLVGDFK